MRKEYLELYTDYLIASFGKTTATGFSEIYNVFMSIYASAKLEILAIKHKVNTFALRAKIYLSAIKNAFFQLRELNGA